MGNLDEMEFLHEYNKMCGRILRQEREKRKISKEDLASGLMSRTTLGNLEAGQSGWSKVTGDILLHRMGVATDYFEMVASSEELDRWRQREEICQIIWEQQETARRKVKDYSERYVTKTPGEEQFLLKAEVFLMLLDRKNGINVDMSQLSVLAGNAIDCTVVGGWGERIAGDCGYGEQNFYHLWLAPVELEAFLLMAAVLEVCGRREEAGNLQKMVWNYPKAHQWSQRMEILILPQAAILALELARGVQNSFVVGEGCSMSGVEDMRTAFACGKEAMELLRRCRSHCYVLPLLERLCMISASDSESEEYLKQAVVFRDTFRQIYEWFHYPASRLWQGIFVDNTREVGTVLKMLRKFDGKSCAEASRDKEGIIVTARQLEKIERGDHKPSYVNYQRLVKQYGILGTWNIAMLETDSVEVLEQRQRISTLISLGEWSKAQWEIERFRKRVNETYPRVGQELLFWDALTLKRKNELEKSLTMMQQALHCTVPDAMRQSMEEGTFRGKKLKWWVFQREEIMIASNIASIYRRMGRLEESKEWFEAVLHSLREQSKRTGIMHVGYEIVMEGYDNLLGDMDFLEKALEMNEEAIRNYLKEWQIYVMARGFYRMAWNAMEMEKRLSMEEGIAIESLFKGKTIPEGREIETVHNNLKQIRKKSFRISEILASFTYDSKLGDFLEIREQIYLSSI